MSARRTPGPWRILWVKSSAIITSDDGIYDVAIVRDIGNEDNKANARLIAAAPDLLNALLAIYNRHNAETMTTAREAIAKATGAAS